MTACPHFDHLFVVPHVRVQNANAISSPLTHGFPSITAFIGLQWALERKARTAGIDVAFAGVGVVCHEHQEQTTSGGFVKQFALTRNPVDKDGSTAAIVEEGRIHLDVTLVFAVSSERWCRDPDARSAEATKLAALLAGMRVAGGSVLPNAQPERRRYQPYVVDLTGNDEDRSFVFRRARMRLLPGFTLVARDDLLESRAAELQAGNDAATRLDAWLSLAGITWRHHATADTPKGRWQHDRSGLGWIVPIPVGYGALGDVHPAGTVANARDSHTPFRFVESLYSAGQWISPHHLNSPQQLLWYADSRPDAGHYRCRNDYRPVDSFDELD